MTDPNSRLRRMAHKIAGGGAVTCSCEDAPKLSAYVMIDFGANADAFDESDALIAWKCGAKPDNVTAVRASTRFGTSKSGVYSIRETRIPSAAELTGSLSDLLQALLDGKIDGNPYASPVVKRALRTLDLAQGGKGDWTQAKPGQPACEAV